MAGPAPSLSRGRVPAIHASAFGALAAVASDDELVVRRGARV